MNVDEDDSKKPPAMVHRAAHTKSAAVLSRVTFSGDNVSDADKTHPSLDRLKVTLADPDGKETDVRYQWMRLHPLTAMALSNDTSDPVVQLARRFPEYRRAAAQRLSGKDSTLLPSLVSASNVTIDLRDLLMDPPPLMSTAVEAIFDSSSENDDDFDGTPMETEGTHCSKADAIAPTCNGDGRDGDADRGPLDELLHRALLRTASTTSGITEDICATLSQAPWKDISESQLMDQLPSDIVAARIAAKAGAVDSTSMLLFSVDFLTLLANSAHSEAMGRHIFQRLAPVVFSAATKKDHLVGRVAPIDDALSDALGRLARALDGCLAGLTRSQVFSIAETVNNELDSYAYCELITCLGDERSGRHIQ
jgi:hypothetical protein